MAKGTTKTKSNIPGRDAKGRFLPKSALGDFAERINHGKSIDLSKNPIREETQRSLARTTNILDPITLMGSIRKQNAILNRFLDISIANSTNNNQNQKNQIVKARDLVQKQTQLVNIDNKNQQLLEMVNNDLHSIHPDISETAKYTRISSNKLEEIYERLRSIQNQFKLIPFKLDQLKNASSTCNKCDSSGKERGGSGGVGLGGLALAGLGGFAAWKAFKALKKVPVPRPRMSGLNEPKPDINAEEVMQEGDIIPPERPVGKTGPARLPPTIEAESTSEIRPAGSPKSNLQLPEEPFKGVDVFKDTNLRPKATVPSVKQHYGEIIPPEKPVGEAIPLKQPPTIEAEGNPYEFENAEAMGKNNSLEPSPQPQEQAKIESPKGINDLTEQERTQNKANALQDIEKKLPSAVGTSILGKILPKLLGPIGLITSLLQPNKSIASQQQENDLINLGHKAHGEAETAPLIEKPIPQGKGPSILGVKVGGGLNQSDDSATQKALHPNIKALARPNDYDPSDARFGNTPGSGNVPKSWLSPTGKPGPTYQSQSMNDYSAPGTAITGKDFQEKSPKIIKNLMSDFNLSKEQAAGVVGNLGHESGGFKQMQEINPMGGGKGGYGWAQWTGPRREEYFAYAKANNLNPDSDEANYGFLKHELQGKYKGAIDAVKQTNNLNDSTVAFEQNYEKAGIKAYGSRTKYAASASQSFDKQQTSLTPPENKSGEKLQVAENQRKGMDSKLQQQKDQPIVISAPTNVSSGNKSQPQQGPMPSVRNDDPAILAALRQDLMMT